MGTVKTVDAKYVFLDIVKYSKRHVEAQCDIIGNLNNIVKNTITSFELEDKVKYLPTGDGMCIAILNTNDPFDIHIQVALKILENLQEYNDFQQDSARKFEVRVGINGNIDNLITDINGEENVAGTGINYSQRVMSFADGGNILIGEPIYTYLSQQEKYLNSFTKFQAVVKHGVLINVYQYVNNEFSYLNNTEPEAFRIEKVPAPKLTNVAAYFIALLIKHTESIKKILNAKIGPAHGLTVALYMLALQYKEDSNRNEFNKPAMLLPDNIEHNVESLTKYYETNNYRTNLELCNYIVLKLEVYNDCFELGGFSYFYPDTFRPKPKGIKKLKEEYPNIVEEFNIK